MWVCLKWLSTLECFLNKSLACVQFKVCCPHSTSGKWNRIYLFKRELSARFFLLLESIIIMLLMEVKQLNLHMQRCRYNLACCLQLIPHCPFVLCSFHPFSFFCSMWSEETAQLKQKWLISYTCCRSWHLIFWKREWWPRWIPMIRSLLELIESRRGLIPEVLYSTEFAVDCT